MPPQVSFDPNGKRKRKFKKLIGATRKQAEQFIIKQTAEQQQVKIAVDEGKPIIANITVGDLLDKWLESRKHRSPSTLRRYRVVVESYLRPAFGPMQVRHLTASDLMEHYGRWETEGWNGRGLGPAAIRDIHETLRAALKWAKRNDLVATVVTDKISSHDLPMLPEYTPHPLTPEEAAKLLDAPGEPGRLTSEEWFRVALLAAIQTGMRRGELLALQWSAVEGDYLTIRRSVDEGTGTYKSPKNGRSRVVPISPVLRKALDDLKAHQQANEIDQGNDLVFHRPDGSPVAPAAFSTAVATRMKKALGHGTLHDLRDTFASVLYAATRDLLLVSKLLGHQNPAITAKRYATIFKDNAADAIAKAFGQSTDSAA